MRGRYRVRKQAARALRERATGYARLVQGTQRVEWGGGELLQRGVVKNGGSVRVVASRSPRWYRCRVHVAGYANLGGAVLQWVVP